MMEVICYVLTGLMTMHAAHAEMAWGSGARDQAVNQEATQKTQDLLINKSKRNQYIEKNKRARQADQQVKTLSSDPKQQQKIYELASEILPNLVQQANGDPVKMQQDLKKALTNPEDFANQLTPDQKTKLKQLSRELSGKQVAP